MSIYIIKNKGRGLIENLTGEDFFDIEKNGRVQSGGTYETPISIKEKYESNPDTNAFTDDYKAILDNPSNFTGESAYQIAVNNGFVGSEVEWLESLQGEDGEPGLNGANGTNAQSFNFKGTVTAYANLPSSGNVANDAYFNTADSKLYVYNGTSFPTNGNGIPFTNALNVAGGALGYDKYSPFFQFAGEILNPLTFVLGGGYFDTTGIASNNVNTLRTGKIACSAGQVIRVTGLGTGGSGGIIDTNGRVFFFAASSGTASSRLGGLGDTIEFTIPAGCNFFGLNVAATTGVGSDPANSPYYQNLKINIVTQNGETGVKTSRLTGAIDLSKIQKKINFAYAVLNGTSPTVNSDGWYSAKTVVPNQITSGQSAGCTGLALDRFRDLFVVSEYNYATSAKLQIFRRSDLVDRNATTGASSTPFRTIDLTSVLDHIQGCAHDWISDTYLAIGRVKGGATSGQNNTIVRCTPFGQVLEVQTLTDLNGTQAGMLDLLQNGDIIYKPNDNANAYFLDRKSFKIKGGFATGNNNEGLAVNKYNGDIWIAGDNMKVRKFDKNFTFIQEFNFQTLISETSGGNVEGMVIDRDGSLIISADTYLHGGHNGGNALFFFDLEGTVNKRLYFDNLNFVNDSGVFTSAAIFTDSKTTSIVVDTNFTATVTYRHGSTLLAMVNNNFNTALSATPYTQIRIQ